MKRLILPLLCLGLCGCAALGLGGDPADPATGMTPEEAESLGGLLTTVGSFFGPWGLAVGGAAGAALTLYAKKKNATKTASAPAKPVPAPVP